MIQLILLSLGFVFFFVLAVTYFWNNSALKFVSLLLAVILANGVYFSLDTKAGWPLGDTKEVKGTIASIVIVNPTDTTEGGIYISVFKTIPEKWYEYEYPRRAPKTFYIEYSNYRAGEFEKAKQQMKEGMRIRINGVPPKNDPKDNNNGEGEGDAEGSSFMNDLAEKLMGGSTEDTYQPDVPTFEADSPAEEEQTQGKPE
jgi:hypothetical protein